MNPEINIQLATTDEPLKKKGGKRVGAGRPALIRENYKRQEMGLKPIPKTPNNKTRDAKSILPISKKARHQEILAGLLNNKGKAVIQKILDKALNDEDTDQMACLKLVADRIIPADYLSKASGKGNQINISITGIGQVEVDEIDMEDIQDAEFSEEE
ncbi:hypothetical protein UFOVP22_49 [uncultured Caudovirales phage]|uniref:Uncharacterized protein n=1 Tax=uncultured Caudovirales phage TaxID=2100421 RepID=A0A6J5T8P5_9CAUD|nr:hypothetical protein UFOVP22_49 [uncultured Caudovirales phage]